MTFEKEIGIEEIRSAAKVYDDCGDTFFNDFSAEELIKIYRLWMKAERNTPPDQWTDLQLADALFFDRIPEWDDEGQPILADIGDLDKTS